eukprot:scaffold248504_cov25-Tisochrysis_lutea.AAC.1
MRTHTVHEHSCVSVQQWSRIIEPEEQQQQQQPQEAAASPTPAAEGSAKGPGGSSSTERGGANELAAAADAGPPALAQPDAHGGASFQASPCANGNKQRGAAQSASAQAQGHGSVSVLADTAAVVAAKALYVVEVTRARASYAEHQQLVNQVEAVCGGGQVHQAPMACLGSGHTIGKLGSKMGSKCGGNNLIVCGSSK